WATAAPREAPPPAATPPPPGASGVFVDAAGGRHPWRVNEAFALLWEGTPYLPAGVVVVPQSLANPSSAPAWEADVAALRTLKEAGVADVLLRPGQPAPGIPVAAWQRLVDHLEAEGFRYGVALPLAPPPPAAGYHIRLGAFRLGPFEPTDAAGAPGSAPPTQEIRLPGLGNGRVERVVAALVDTKSGKLLGIEWPELSPIPEGAKATLSLKKQPTAPYLVEMTPLVSGLAGLPDVWTGFDDLRDSLLALKLVKFGAGLRFFIHPLAGMLDLEGSAGYLIPNSSAYRMGFESFLTRRYRKVETLRMRWAFRAGAPATMEVAARLVPLAVTTNRTPQLGYLLDEKEGRFFAIEPAKSRLWQDHLEYREHSLREYMNQLAQVVNDQVANVPVVTQQAGSLRRFHINDRQAGGMAGIGIEARAAGLHREAGYAIGAARLATPRPWCLALSLEGYQTKEALTDAFETLRRIGMKGGFVAPPAEAPAELPRWVAACGARFTADHQPSYLLFPQSVRESGGFAWQHPPLDVEPRELAGGVWWVPTLAGWDPLDLGPNLGGYGVATPTGYEVHLWSRQGKQRIRLCTPAHDPVEVRNPAGKVIAKPRRGMLRLDLDTEPVVIRGMRGEFVVPVELAQAEFAEYERLVKEAGLKGHSVRQFQGTVSLARALDPEKDPHGVRQLLRAPLAAIRRLAAQEPPQAEPTPPEPAEP
ncbi:MAG: hypothetical protein GX774_15955, partial [Armatimonadetes bacterium]|nr:hypothetical protein [Armatimonadota bacterium]